MAGQTSVVRGDVALAPIDAEVEVVVGSFTVDGLTYAVIEDGVSLVSVDPMLASGPDGADPSVILSEASVAGEVEGSLSLPPSVSYDGTDYALVRIAPLALAGAPIASVSIPETVRSIDSAAALGCEALTEVSVAEANPNFSTFDGYLTDKAQTSILLVPEGRIGQVRIPSTTVTIDPRAFSHCARIDAFAVDADCPGLASWDGSIYTKDLTELVRVPAGATELTLPAECASIGPSALSGCTALRSITALGVVTNIAPSAFGEIEEAEALPSEALVSADEGDVSERPAQVTGLVAVASNALSSIQVDKSAITVTVPEGSDATAWEAAGLSANTPVAMDEPIEPLAAIVSEDVVLEDEPIAIASLDEAQTSAASGYYAQTAPNFSTVVLCWPSDIAYVTHSSLGGKTLDRSAYKWTDLRSSLRQYRFYSGSFWVGRNSGGETNRFGLNGSYTGVTKVEVGSSPVSLSSVSASASWSSPAVPYYVSVNGAREYDTITWNPNDGYGSPTEESVLFSTAAHAPAVSRSGWEFLGWFTEPEGGELVCGAQGTTNAIYYDQTFYAQWKTLMIEFDVNSEPSDENYLGDEMPPIAAPDTVQPDGTIPIEDPKRPGYVFQGWVIPDAETGNKEALDQDLVYQGDDGKWYVDASKLPDYATDGKVELTARWTSIISVDVPSAATFYYDLVTDQSSQAHEAALSGNASFRSRSKIDLRICGLESESASEAGKMFSSGADDDVMSIYPALDNQATTEEEAKQSVGVKPSSAIDFALNDIILEKAFIEAGKQAYEIPAGEELTLSYRLNLGDGIALNQEELLAMVEGDEEMLSSITYTFANGHSHGFSADPSKETFYIEYGGDVYGAANIQAAANCISELGVNSPCYDLYEAMMKTNMDPDDPNDPHGVVKMTDGTTFNVRLADLNHDDLTTPMDGRTKAGMTFEFVQCVAMGKMNSTKTAAGGWQSSLMRTSTLKEGGTIWNRLPADLRERIVPVNKKSLIYGGSFQTTSDKLFLASMAEMGSSIADGAFYSFGGNVRDRYKSYGGTQTLYWLRSGVTVNNACFWRSDSNYPYADVDFGIAPYFCL